MRFDIFGRYQLEISREGDTWTTFRVENGKRRLAPDIIVPSTVRAADIETYLDDLLHEFARPGGTIRRLDR